MEGGEMEKGRVRSHRDLVVWQRSVDLAVDVYRRSRRFPKDEMYRLTSQVTRAVASVPANIAEGNARSTRREYAHFLSIAKGSRMEAETFLVLSVRLGYLPPADTDSTFRLITEISKMLTALRARLR
jgi:four helix bundle protein